MPPSESPAGRYHIVALGLVAVASLACLAVVGPPMAYLSKSGPRVVAAVHASFPELCHEWRDKLVARPSPASWYTSWDVSCISGYAASDNKVMTVNVVTCQWREPLELSTDWHKLLATITAAGQRLQPCP